jgi:hypothetical protein
MTEVDNIILEQLRALRKEVAEIKDGLTSVRVEISALGQQLAGLLVEKRLELTE